MAGELNYTEVTEIVNAMDSDFSELRKDARARYELYALRRDPHVVDEIAREGKERVLSPLLIHAAQTIRADIMMNPTEFTVIPLAREKDGRIPNKAQQMAENLERAYAVIWGKLNEGRRIDRDIIWHQLISPFGVMILEFGEFSPPDQPEWMEDDAYVTLTETYERDWMPWSVYLPDPMTCSWMEKDGKPTIFARKYKMLARDLEDMYNKKPSSTHPDQRFHYTGESFQWVSDDYTPDITHYRAGFKEIDMLWLDDGKYIYQIASCGSGPEDGEILECVPNPVGRVTAFVVAGNLTPSRAIADRYEPFLWPLMQAVNGLNDSRSTRATAARNLAGPHTYVALNPEIVKIYLERKEKLPTSVRWRKNEVHYLMGDIKPVPSELSPDFDKLEQSLYEEMQRFLPSPFVNVVDPAVLKAATATSILHAAESGLRMYGPLMSAEDSAIRDMMECIELSVINLYDDQDIAAYATGDEMSRGKNLSQGNVYRVNKDAVNFPHRTLVKTRGMSQAQAAAQFDLVLKQWVLPDGSKGPATMEDLIDAANYTDSVAQRVKLAKEAILDAIDPWIQEEAINRAHDKILAKSGIDVPIGTQPGAAPGQPSAQPGAANPQRGEEQPSGLPNSAQRMDAPMLTGPQGGSAAGMEGFM